MPDSNNTVNHQLESPGTKVEVGKKACVIISDPEIIKILLDDKRKAILHVLRKGIVDSPAEEGSKDQPRRHEMTAIEIVDQLKAEGHPIKKSAVYFHLDKLESVGLIEVARKEQKKRSQITYYRRTASIFLISYRDAPEIREVVEKTYGKRGTEFIELVIQTYIPDAEPEIKDRVKQLMNDFYCHKDELQLQVADKMKGEVPENKAVKVFETGLDILFAGNPKHHEVGKELSKLLFGS